MVVETKDQVVVAECVPVPDCAFAIVDLGFHDPWPDIGNPGDFAASHRGRLPVSHLGRRCSFRPGIHCISDNRYQI